MGAGGVRVTAGEGGGRPPPGFVSKYVDKGPGPGLGSGSGGGPGSGHGEKGESSGKLGRSERVGGPSSRGESRAFSFVLSASFK